VDPLSRQRAARAVNAGLVLAAVAVLVVVGSGGATIDLGPVSLPLGQAFLPLLCLGALAGVRVLLGSRTGGLEARVLRAFARLGLPPRDLPAAPFRAARGGVVLGAGFGASIALADGVRVALSSRPAAAASSAALGALTLSGLVAVALAALFGALVAAGVAGLFPRLAGRRAGRYEAGRWTAAALLAAGPFVLLLAPPLATGERTPFVMVGTALALLAGLAFFCFVLPAAWLQLQGGRFTLPLAVAGLVVLAAAAWVLRGAVPRGESTGAAVYPNVLLVTITGLRADAVGSYGATTTATPALDALAEQGAAFRDTVTPSRFTPAAAASLLTGLYPSSHGLRDDGDALRPGIEGLPERLTANGYHCAAFVSARPLEGRRSGLARLFENYEDAAALSDWLPRFTFGRLLLRAVPASPRPVRGPRPALELFRSWIGTLPPGVPWCAWVELGEPAWPLPASPRGGSDEVAVPAGRVAMAEPLQDPPAWSPGAARKRSLAAWMEGYRAAVVAADAAVGALQQLLLERGELHRTLVVVTAEGGIPLGEQGAWIEGPAGLEEGIVRVPWLIAGPGVGAAVQVGGPSSLVDVAPTLLGLLRLGGARDAEGEDLSRFLGAAAREERDPGSGPVFSEARAAPGGGRPRAIRIGGWKLVRDTDGGERLFQASAGAEQEILAPRDRALRVREELAEKLAERIARERDLAGERP
jgi:arylsulfatase A-like enzyme